MMRFLLLLFCLLSATMIQAQSKWRDKPVKNIELKEVTIKAQKTRQRGDTLVYSVATFAKDDDRSIGDVLKKMPGIQVAEDGKITYNGTPINKFYIEGKDLLQGRYGLATNGV